MISPETIDLSALPSLGLADRRKLPHYSAIYFVLEDDTVVYIGQTNSLLLRWRGHNKLKQFKNLPGTVRICWLECSDASLLNSIETALVEFFNPRFNAPRDYDRRRQQRDLDKLIRCNLRPMMEEKGLSQLALAEETGLAVATVGSLYRDQFTRIDCETALVLCSYFDCGLCDLFTIVDR